MFYNYVQPILISLDKNKISELAIGANVSWEQMTMIKIKEIKNKILEILEIKKDTLYLIVYPKNTFQSLEKTPLTKEQVEIILTSLSNLISPISNVVLIAGTVFWKDEDEKIYNSAIMFYREEIEMWDTLFPYVTEEKEIPSLGRWMAENIENSIGSMHYIVGDSNLSFPITFEKKQNNLILYGYESAGIDGKQVVYISKIDHLESEEQQRELEEETKKQLQQRMVEEIILPYTLQEGLIPSSLSNRTPLFSLDKENYPAIAIDIDKDYNLEVAKYYAKVMQKESNIQIHIILGDTNFSPCHITTSASIIIQCGINELRCTDDKNGLKEANTEKENRLINDCILKKHIYKPMPLLVV